MKPQLKALLAAVSLAVPLASQAVDLPINTWTGFYFAEAGSVLLDKPAFDDAALPVSFSFVADTPALLRVTDLNLAGDRFQWVLDGQVLGATSVPVGSLADDLGVDHEGAYANALGSHGAWVIEAGSHTLSGIVMASPLGAGNGALQLSAVPETNPAAMLTVALGLFVMRRRAARR